VTAALSTDNNGDRNWYKPDINLDIILWAAPMVQHIHLHWSGNQAVLYGWASEDGIPFLYRSSETLAKVTLHAYQVSIYSKGKEIWGYIRAGTNRRLIKGHGKPGAQKGYDRSVQGADKEKNS
jgi:hypothetical protein